MKSKIHNKILIISSVFTLSYSTKARKTSYVIGVKVHVYK